VGRGKREIIQDYREKLNHFKDLPPAGTAGTDDTPQKL